MWWQGRTLTSFCSWKLTPRMKTWAVWLARNGGSWGCILLLTMLGDRTVQL
jgi:hypothetical protein